MTREAIMILRGFATVLLVALAAESHDAPPPVGCRNTHEWIDVGELDAATVVGSVEVRYEAGDSARLPDTTVIVARVHPSIQAYVAHTDKHGAFAIPQVPEGRWRVNVCKVRFKTLEATLTVDKATHRELRFTTGLDW